MSKSKTAQQPTQPQKWLNSKQAGQYLGLSDWTIRNYADRKLIDHARLPGGDYRFTREALDAFMQSREVTTKTPLAVPEKPRLYPPSGSRFETALRKIAQKRTQSMKGAK